MTPESVHSIINSYSEVGEDKEEEEIGEKRVTMNLGLQKLDKASKAVELLKEKLVEMESEIGDAH